MLLVHRLPNLLAHVVHYMKGSMPDGTLPVQRVKAWVVLSVQFLLIDIRKELLIDIISSSIQSFSLVGACLVTHRLLIPHPARLKHFNQLSTKNQLRSFPSK